MTRPELVMMIPLRRCGSNAIRLRLNLHPDFYSPYPLHVSDFLPYLPDYGDLSDDDNYFRLITDVIGLQDMSLIRWPVSEDPVRIFDAIKNEPRSVHRIIGELYLRAGHDKKIVMDKSQDSVSAFREIVALFPSVRFLDIVRDPRAQISSMNRSIIYDYDTMLNTQRWVEARQWVDQIYKSYPEKILTVRFEDFLKNQEETLREICSFLHLPYLNQMTEIERSEDALFMSKQSPLWESNSMTPDLSNIDKYTLHLTHEEIEHIEWMTKPWMNQYGYEPLYTNPIPLSYTLLDARRRSNEKKEGVWKKLRLTHPKDYILRKRRERFLQSLKTPVI